MNISIVIPVYNAEKYLKQAVLSAVEQEETGEILLIEDCSPDNSLEICKELQLNYPDTIKILQHPDKKNHGAGASRNLGIINAECDYIAFLDADDYYLPIRFNEAIKIFKNDPSIDGVYEAVGTYFQDEKNKKKWFNNRVETMTTVLEETSPQKLFDVLTKGGRGFFHGNGLTVKKNIFNKIGLFDSHLVLSQDFAMWIKMAAVGKLAGGNIKEPVAMRRVHNDNRMMSSKEKEKKYAIMMWETLIEWGRQNKINNSKMINLYNAYLYTNIYHSLSKSSSFLKKRSIEFRSLFKMIYKYPILLIMPKYWYLLTIKLFELSFVLKPNGEN